MNMMYLICGLCSILVVIEPALSMLVVVFDGCVLKDCRCLGLAFRLVYGGVKRVQLEHICAGKAVGAYLGAGASGLLQHHMVGWGCGLVRAVTFCTCGRGLECCELVVYGMLGQVDRVCRGQGYVYAVMLCCLL